MLGKVIKNLELLLDKEMDVFKKTNNDYKAHLYENNAISLRDDVIKGQLHEQLASLKWNRYQRVVIIAVVLSLFLWLNYNVIRMIEEAVKIDISMLNAKLIIPNERIINTKIYLALITGTVIEVASLLIAIFGYLFPKNKL